MIQTPDVQPTSSITSSSELSLTTLVLASSVSFGSNLLEVKKGRMEPEVAVSNAVVKGVLSTAVISAMRPATPLRVAGCACLLGGVGYIVDSLMKNSPRSV